MTDNQNTVNHCATCGHYQEYHVCDAGDVGRPCKAANMACELYTTERASDLTYEDYVYPWGWRPGDFG